MPNRIRSYPIDVDTTLATNATITADNNYYYYSTTTMYTSSTSSYRVVLPATENINITVDNSTSYRINPYYVYEYTNCKVKKKIEWVQEEMEL